MPHWYRHAEMKKRNAVFNPLIFGKFLIAGSNVK
jgi:hypothetical protein